MSVPLEARGRRTSDLLNAALPTELRSPMPQEELFRAARTTHLAGTA
jgi:hypothetical protein